MNVKNLGKHQLAYIDQLIDQMNRQGETECCAKFNMEVSAQHRRLLNSLADRGIIVWGENSRNIYTACLTPEACKHYKQD